MIKLPLPKLIKWLVRQFLFLTFISFAVSLVCFYLFFENPKFSNFISVFLISFSFSSFIIFFLLARFLHPLARVVSRARDIRKGRDSLNTRLDPFLDEEPGEFHELNRNLNQINSYLRWQKGVIYQESAELEAVISALTEAILAIDKRKKVLFFNNQAASLFSSQRPFDKTEILLSEMIRSPDILRAYDECLKTGSVIKKTVSVGVFDTEEEEVFYEITAAPLKKIDGQIHGAVGLFYDITNIRKTEKMQLDFITNVSHELRTPLTVIQGYVEALLEPSAEKEKPDENIEKQTKQFLNIIQRNVKRLVSLLNHFLELSQMEDSQKIKKEKLNAEEITLSIIKDMHIKDHKIKTDFSQKTVHADRRFLEQVLYNLIDNAVKYVPKGRLIEVIWKKEGSNVILTVKDHGEGIPGKHKGRLFERFYRVDPARKKVRGAGIGLPIVKQLLEKHGGSIHVKSEPKEGSAFICSFPD